MENVLVSVVYKVQKRLSTVFSFTEIVSVLDYTMQKCSATGKSYDYIPNLFETELMDYAMRRQFT